MYHDINVRKVPCDMKTQQVNKELIHRLLRATISECPFSLFPYIHGHNSYESQCKKQGDCVALSIYLQRKLRKRCIKSVLVPATIPNNLKLPGYLTISHVALAIWNGCDEVFVCDPAFYFESPMVVSLKQGTGGTIRLRDVYSNSTKNLEYAPYIQKEKYVMNDHQTIPANTHLVETYSEDLPDDRWQYYLIEVLNPDEAITSFFVNIVRYPFIAIVDSELHMSFYLKFKDAKNIVIKLYNRKVYHGDVDDVPCAIDDLISKYLTSGWRAMMQLPSDIDDKTFYFKDHKCRCYFCNLK